MIKIATYVLLGILFLLVITNPSDRSFRGFLGESEFGNEYRKENYLIYGVYSVEYVTPNDSVFIKQDFLAVFGKFYKINQPVKINRK